MILYLRHVHNFCVSYLRNFQVNAILEGLGHKICRVHVNPSQLPSASIHRHNIKANLGAEVPVPRPRVLLSDLLNGEPPQFNVTVLLL